MIYIISNNNKYLYYPKLAHTNVDRLYITPNSNLSTIDLTETVIYWEACDDDLFTFKIQVNDDDTITFTSTFSKIYEVITSCCFLESLNIITKSEYKSEFDYITNELSNLGCKINITILPPNNIIQSPVLSLVGYDLKKTPTYLPRNTNVSIPYTSIQHYKRSELMELKNSLEENGNSIIAINSLFNHNMNINMFYNTNMFYDKFLKIIKIADLLSIKYIIFGSNYSKIIKPTEKRYIYNEYQNCDIKFIQVLKEIASYIQSNNYDVSIIIKPSKKGNYLNNQDTADNLVAAIDMENVLVGPLRESNYINHNPFFDLIECTHLDKFEKFVDVLLHKRLLL